MPIQLTGFVGRGRELGEVRRLMASSRLLTLVGMGGVGKTRLALQAAAEPLDVYPDGVWLVELASLADPAQLPAAVAAALATRPRRDRLDRDAVAALIGDRRLLLLLDGCEHLATTCADLAGSLLRTCPGLRILATSQEPLDLGGETLWRVLPLDVPEPTRLPPPAELGRLDAVQLFVARAQAAMPAFGLTGANLRPVAELCARLDGVPLALELAAARMPALGLDQLVARSRNGAHALTIGGRPAPTRRPTLRATLDCSYRRLSEPEQRLLAWLSVFIGGWTSEAAERVCQGVADRSAATANPAAGADVVDLLACLVDRSLVVAEPLPDEAVRYRLLELVRVYARERLLERGEEQAAQSHHAAYFLALAERAEPELARPDRAAWLRRLEREHDNLRAALCWTLEQRDVQSGLRFNAALLTCWGARATLDAGAAAPEPPAGRVAGAGSAGPTAVQPPRSRGRQRAAASRRRATGPAGGGPDALTPREREVTGLVAIGLPNRKIAARLIIAEGTAERHVANILEKLGLGSRTRLALWAVEQGIAPADG